MSFASSMTYVYAYVAFACIYVVGSIVLARSTITASSKLSRRAADSDEQAHRMSGPDPALGHGRRLIDYTQAATALPLIYIVSSVLLGSFAARNPGGAGIINIGWIALTLVCGAASILLAIVAYRESAQLKTRAGAGTTAADESLQKIGLQLGVSTALLLLIAAFTLLNVWSVISDIEALKAVDFLL